MTLRDFLQGLYAGSVFVLLVMTINPVTTQGYIAVMAVAVAVSMLADWLTPIAPAASQPKFGADAAIKILAKAEMEAQVLGPDADTAQQHVSRVLGWAAAYSDAIGVPNVAEKELRSTAEGYRAQTQKLDRKIMALESRYKTWKRGLEGLSTVFVSAFSGVAVAVSLLLVGWLLWQLLVFIWVVGVAGFAFLIAALSAAWTLVASTAWPTIVAILWFFAVVLAVAVVWIFRSALEKGAAFAANVATVCASVSYHRRIDRADADAKKAAVKGDFYAELLGKYTEALKTQK